MCIKCTELARRYNAVRSKLIKIVEWREILLDGETFDVWYMPKGCCIPESNIQQSSEATVTYFSINKMVSEGGCCDRRALIFPHIDTDVQTNSVDNVDESDSFYELTIADARILQSYLHEQAFVCLNEQPNKWMLSTSERPLVTRGYVAEQNKQRKQAAFLHTVVRFVFSSGDIIQALFYSSEPASHLYDFITSLLLDQTLTFILSFGLKQNINNDTSKTLIDVEVAPSSRIYVNFSKKDLDYSALFAKNILKDSSRTEADICSREWLSANSTFIPFKPAFERNESVRELSGSPSLSSGVCRKLESGTAPKWFKRQ